MNGVTAERIIFRRFPWKCWISGWTAFGKNGLYYIPDIEEEQGQPCCRDSEDAGHYQAAGRSFKQ